MARRFSGIQQCNSYLDRLLLGTGKAASTPAKAYAKVGIEREYSTSTPCFANDKPKHYGKKEGAPCRNVRVPEEYGFKPGMLPGFENVAREHGLKTYKDVYRFSLEHNDLFWESCAKMLNWKEPFHTVQDCDLKKGKVGWFLGGKLNVSENCLDRHVAEDPNKIALLWEKDEPGTVQISYGQLLEWTCKMANTLKQARVQKGDCVCVYLPTSPMAVASMLACARIGAIHTVVFAGFSSESLRDRIQNCKAKVVITANEMIRGGKSIPLKQLVDDAVKDCPTVKTVFVEQRTKKEGRYAKHDVALTDALDAASAECAPEVLDSEDPLFVLYTSGSTGKPKGVLHTQAGYLLYAALTQKVVFNLKPGEVFGCLADIGWITGHSYVVYAPLANGITTVLFESTPNYPSPSRYWSTVERLKINHLYISPTALRSLLRHGKSHVKNHDLSSLRTLGLVGEPVNHEAWEWYYDVIGQRRCPVVDTWWQTETGGISIAPLPGDSADPIYPGMAMRPFFGIEPVVKNSEAFADHGSDQAGVLYVARPWPGMLRGIYGDEERFVETYLSEKPGCYTTGDGCVETADGYFKITGRVDDVINVSGHRLGTAEVENAIDSHGKVAESAVVSFPHLVKGEGLAAFVVLTDDYEADEHLVKDLKGLIKHSIASYAIPEEIVIVPHLPKTRSGKIMRRLLKLIAQNKNEDFGDTSTLQDPDILKPIIDAWSKTTTAAEYRNAKAQGTTRETSTN
ncbi:hypothetical protein RvY_05049 [Ramazzottius varieornatus]|uniref:Acetyl-coenzyme A synthetase n=1 Tax=Ramazzottius varieornatus TaxID=947166 RepID=A0A1D1V3M3_RAMVA|nr:hypothetical protein RvY_05049 [Ramazzottius varieornatus]